MKNLCCFLFLLVLLLAGPRYAKAAAAADFIYEWVSDSTYRVTVKLYAPCGYLFYQEPTFVTICIKNPCTQFITNYDLQKVHTVPTRVKPPCFVNMKAKCDSAASPVDETVEWIYSGLIKLTGKCANWRLTIRPWGRLGAYNVWPQTPAHMSMDDTMNNNFINSTPHFLAKPVMYAIANHPVSYNSLAVDPDGDSLVTELIWPQQTSNVPSCGVSTNSIYLLTGTPAYNLTTNPIQTNNSFVLNPATGQMSFTPAIPGSWVIGMKITEYRAGIKIASDIRELRVFVLPDAAYAPTMEIVSGKLFNGNVMGCVGQQLKFCYDIESANDTAKLTVSDDHNLLPGAGVFYSNPKTDSVRGCITWTPGHNDAGGHTLNLVVRDSACTSTGFIQEYHYSIPIYISTDPSITIAATPGTSVWPGVAVTFTASHTVCQNGTLQWKVNNVAVPGANSSIWTTTTLANNSIVTCELTCPDGCKPSAVSNALNMKVATSVDNADTAGRINIYPNPNSGSFRVSGYAGHTATATLGIYNMQGQIVYSRTIPTSRDSIDELLDTGNLPAGIYMLRIKSGSHADALRFTICK